MKLTQSELDALLRKNKGVTIDDNDKRDALIKLLDKKVFKETMYNLVDGRLVVAPEPPISQPEAKEGGSISLYLEGIPPSKKNSKQIISIPCKGGKRRPMLISSKKYLEWEKWAMIEFNCQYKGPLIDWPICIHFTFYYKDKRIWDLSNKIEGLTDAMRVVVIKDDHRFIVAKLIVEQEPACKGHQAGVNIRISPLK